MTKLVVRQGFYKRADENGDGPSFEQQFGILANAVVVDRCPRLDKNKIAFQLIEKKDDNTKAAGVCVYKLGKSVIFIPVFYTQGNVEFCNVIYKVKQSLFVPCTDAWLAAIENEEIPEAGELVEEGADSHKGAPGDTSTTSVLSDPIVKSACFHFRKMMHNMFDKRNSNYSVLDGALGMGKKACLTLMNKLTDDKNFLNAALHFYTPSSLNIFAKTATYFDKEHKDTWLITPFSKEASYLTDPYDVECLKRDGYLVKTAKKELSNIIKKDKVKDCFKTIGKPGKYELMNHEGELEEHLVMAYKQLNTFCDASDFDCTDLSCSSNKNDSGFDYMTKRSVRFVIISDDMDCADNCQALRGTVAVADNKDTAFAPSMIADYGELLAKYKKDIHGCVFLCPNGVAYNTCSTFVYNKGAWYSDVTYADVKSIVVGDSPDQIAPIVLRNSIVMPAGTRIIARKIEGETGKLKRTFVTISDLPVYLNKYLKKHYRQLKVTKGGDEVVIDGAKSDSKPLSVKEASYHLVNDYGLMPSMAANVLADVHKGGFYNTETYLIEKKAADGWEDSPLSMKEVTNKEEPDKTTLKMPSTLEDNPAQLTQAVTNAAQAGIKEVFDVSVIKLLIGDADLAEGKDKDLKLYMQMLDNVCRKFLVIKWQIENFKSLWGEEKVAEILANIKKSMDALSIIILFFKQKFKMNQGDDFVGNAASFLSNDDDGASN